MMMLIGKELLGINGVDDYVTLYLSVAFSKVHLFKQMLRPMMENQRTIKETAF